MSHKRATRPALLTTSVVLSSQKQPWCMALLASLQAAQALLCQAFCLPYIQALCLCSCTHGTWCFKRSASCSNTHAHQPAHAHPSPFFMTVSQNKSLCSCGDSTSCAVAAAGAAVLPATGLGSNNKALRWDRGMLVAHYPQTSGAKKQTCILDSFAWLACTLARNCMCQCLCSNSCEVLVMMHSPCMHSKLPAEKVYDGTSEYHIHPSSTLFADWNSVFLNALSTALLFSSLLPACIACIRLQEGRRLTDSKR